MNKKSNISQDLIRVIPSPAHPSSWVVEKLSSQHPYRGSNGRQSDSNGDGATSYLREGLRPYFGIQRRVLFLLLPALVAQPALFTPYTHIDIFFLISPFQTVSQALETILNLTLELE